jgi:Na+-translocating ferredoxin:NAD+ oxidoreductase RnfE subunit
MPCAVVRCIIFGRDHAARVPDKFAQSDADDRKAGCGFRGAEFS